MDKEQSHEKCETLYPEHFIEHAKAPKQFGRMNSSTSSASIKGPCGDEIEFYLIITNAIIEDVTY